MMIKMWERINEKFKKYPARIRVAEKMIELGLSLNEDGKNEARKVASEIDLKIPSLDVAYNIFGFSVTGSQILLYGLGVCLVGLLFGLGEFFGIKKLPAHKAMLNVSHTIHYLFLFQNLRYY